MLWPGHAYRLANSREGYSIDAQIRAMREKAAKAGWTIVREFVVAESAKRGSDRVAFNKMFKWGQSPMPNERRSMPSLPTSSIASVVICGMRFAFRSWRIPAGWSWPLSKTSSVQEPPVRFPSTLWPPVAQYYSDNLRTEVIKGMDEKVRQGWPTGLAPYGYLNVDDRNEPVVPHPEKSKTIIFVFFELYASGQYTFKSLADKLAAEGHTYQPSQAEISSHGSVLYP